MLTDAAAAHARLMDAVILGERFYIAFGSVILMAIFWKDAFQYFASALRRRPPVKNSKHFAGGIFLFGVGMVFSVGVRVVLDEFWPDFPLAFPMMALGLLVLAAGQFLQFRAWAAEVYPGLRYLSLYWTIGLAILAVAGVSLAFGFY